MTSRSMPLKNSKFKVTIDGTTYDMHSVRGIGLFDETAEFRRAEYFSMVNEAHGFGRFSHLIMERRVGLGTELWEWRKRIVTGAEDLRDLTVEIMDEGETTPVWTVKVEDAWPSGWSLGKLDSLESEILMETVELAYARFDIEQAQT